MAQHRISGVPVTKDGKAVGILTNRDLRFVRDDDQPISNVMTPREKLVTVAPGTQLERCKERCRAPLRAATDEQAICAAADQGLRRTSLPELAKTSSAPAVRRRSVLIVERAGHSGAAST
jgi:hypothetical protein